MLINLYAETKQEAVSILLIGHRQGWPRESVVMCLEDVAVRLLEQGKSFDHAVVKRVIAHLMAQEG